MPSSETPTTIHICRNARPDPIVVLLQSGLYRVETCKRNQAGSSQLRSPGLSNIVDELTTPKFIVLYIWLAFTISVHVRGKVRHRFIRQLTDHSTLMAPYNLFAFLFSAVPRTPMLDVRQIPDLALLRENWKTIRDEALNLYEAGHIRSADKFNDLAFNTFFRYGWTRFYLKWYDDPLPSARELCHQSLALIESIPSINAALFAVMPPRSRLGKHRDPFAGSLRYHLGLATPNDDNCRIYVDGERYSWRDGEDVLFDETYVHSAKNETDEFRIILFCDVTRPLQTRLARSINQFVIDHIIKISASQNVPSEKIGILNHIAAGIYKIKIMLESIKDWNSNIYYTMKYVLMAWLAYVVFLKELFGQYWPGA